ncbi:MAG TPA: type II secretion system F family protein [Paracoccaceae bacterium]|nr:type II secretion system F family protein [Paracoccaceae bacterium]
MSQELATIISGLPPGIVPAAVFVLVLTASGALLWLLFQERLSWQAALRNRLGTAAGFELNSPGIGGPVSEQRRRHSIEKALNELAERERAKQKAKLTLPMRLDQAGLDWGLGGFHLRMAAVALLGVAAAKFVIGLALPLAALAGAVIGFLAMHFLVQSRRAKRIRSFLEEFPNAIDVVTRGVKTGLPISDCLKAIALEGQEPVRGEFRRIVDDLALGLSLTQALGRFTQRVPILEVNFFAVVLTVQSQLGGNLSDALGNLSRVLRERKMMKEKIRAFSSEATASGAIIASMPVAVTGILSLTSPDYIGLLLSEFIGNVVLGVSALWMIIGVVVMRKMISFDY